MKKALLFVLALIAVGCAEGEPEEPGICADIDIASPVENARTAVKYLDVHLCAARGSANAQYNYGLMYANGEAVPEDDAEAVRWYRLAAAQGNADAHVSLGFMYSHGRGVPEDDVLAYMWYNLAGALFASDEDAQRSQQGKDFVEQRMTREQVAEAQRMSREWLEAHPSGN